ncbi:MAG: ribonuclease P protein component [Clostridia bacterium]|nr:ribonuclease P protein component [Clostridia bacterium]
MAKIIPIKENYLFSKIYAKGKKASEKNIAVYALRNYKTADTRLGITTGKKLGSAVQRSRARRLIREAFRHSTEGRSFKKPFWIVVVARSSITAKDRKMDDVRRDLEKAFAKLTLFSEETQN